MFNIKQGLMNSSLTAGWAPPSAPRWIRRHLKKSINHQPSHPVAHLYTFDLATLLQSTHTVAHSQIAAQHSRAKSCFAMKFRATISNGGQQPPVQDVVHKAWCQCYSRSSVLVEDERTQIHPNPPKTVHLQDPTKNILAGSCRFLLMNVVGRGDRKLSETIKG